jgi:hypothetical protein
MLKTLAAVVLATSMITNTAFAAKPSGNVGATAAANAGSNAKTVVGATQPNTAVKYTGTQTRKNVAKEAHHFKGVKTHKTLVAKVTKGAKTAKKGRTHSANLAHHLTKTN